MADAATIAVLIQAKDNASREFKNVENNMGKMVQGIQKHRRAIGMAMTAMGAAITGIAVMSVKSAFDQEKGIRQLDTALQKVGTSYEQQKAQIEAVVAAQQNKTNFGDEEQRDALRELILVSGNYDDAMKALVPTIELAAGKEMELGAAATLVARAISGEESALNRYGVSVEKGADSTEVLSAIMAKFQGQAEAAADPTTQLKNRMGDLFQVFGSALLPVIETLVPLIEKMVRRMIEWTEAHPNLTRVLGIVVAALGAIMLVLGPLLLILPTLVTGIGLVSAAFVALNLSMGPITLVVLGIAAAITTAILVWKNWDKIIGVVKQGINLFVKATIAYITTWLQGLKAVVSWIPGLGKVEDAIESAISTLKGFADSTDSWANNSEGKLREQAHAWGAMEDAHHSVAGAIETQNEGMTDANNRHAEKTRESARTIANAWGDVEDATMEMARTHADELQRMADEEQRSADIFASISEARVQTALDESQARKDAFWSTVRETERAEQAHDRTLSRLRDSLDETTIKWKDSGLEMEDVVKRWAKSTNQSTDDVLNHWDLIDLDLSDLKDVFARFTEATGQDIFNWSADMGSASDAVSRALGTTASDVRSIAMGIHDTIAGIHRDASRPVPAPRVGGFSGGGGGGGGFAGIHTGTGFNKATVVANQAVEALKGTPSAGGLAGFAAGTTFAQIEAALGLANGGIVRSPTLAMIGERGPEAVIPLGKGGGMGTVNNFHFHGSVYGVEDLKEAVVEAVRDHAISGGFAGVFAEA